MAGLTEICEQQFMDCFLSLAMSKCVCDKLIFLNYDCHHSHKTVDVQWVMFHKNVVLTAFPSKTTHKTQPLDVKILSAVQNWWSYRCDKHVAEGITINQYNVIHKYLQVSHIITPELTQAALCMMGIYPLNLFIFTADDYELNLACWGSDLCFLWLLQIYLIIYYVGLLLFTK